VKGAGEAGTVGALPAVMNAIVDALGAAGGEGVRYAGDGGSGVAGDTGGAQPLEDRGTSRFDCEEYLSLNFRFWARSGHSV
jgi:hypothetical protein